MSINGQWGTKQYTGNSAPNWFKKTTVGAGSGTYPANNIVYGRPNHPADNHNLELTDRGWEKVIRYTDHAGKLRTKREVVIATGGLANTVAYSANTVAANNAVAGPVITDIRWSTANNTNGRVSGAAGGDGILFAEAGGVGVIVTFSEPVYVGNAGLSVGADFASVNVGGTDSGTQGGSGDYYIDCRLTSGNGTNQLTFTNTTALSTADTFQLADAELFIELDGAAFIVAASGYSGRNANTNAFVSNKRPANVSSYGVGWAGDVGDTVLGVTSRTLAADCGSRDSTNA